MIKPGTCLGAYEVSRDSRSLLVETPTRDDKLWLLLRKDTKKDEL